MKNVSGNVVLFKDPPHATNQAEASRETANGIRPQQVSNSSLGSKSLQEQAVRFGTEVVD
jgi:hypothetical protein